MDKSKLLIGSGTWHWPGYLTIDANPANEPDIVAVLPPFPEQVLSMRFEEIVASHVIEHFYLWDARKILATCYELLLPGGELILEQPNIHYCAEVLVGARLPPEGRDWAQFSLWGLYGAPNGNPWDGHHWGYTPASLEKLLCEVGFDSRQIMTGLGRWHEPERDFQLRARK